MKRLAILGGGYGGMRILQRLFASGFPDDYEITLIDRTPFHSLKTEFYALAAGTVPENYIRVAFPEHEKLTIHNAEVERIDLDEQKIILEDGWEIAYDELIIGLGCEDNYHDVPGAKEHTLSIQTIRQARHTYTVLNDLPMNSRVAIVGAGLSGVELASELYESRPDLDIRLFDRKPTILANFPKKISEFVNEWFVEHGIKIISHANITKVSEGVLYNHDEPIPVDAIVWTAGIKPNQIVCDLDVEKDESGRVILTPHHYVPDYPNVYVVGDCASLPFAPSAQLAEVQGEQIVDVLLKRWRGEPLDEEPPEIKLKGTLGSLGKKQGFGLINEIPLIGRVPRLLKSGVLWLYKFQNA